VPVYNELTDEWVPTLGEELAVRIAAAHDGGRGSPIEGDAPGHEQRCSAGVSAAGLATAEAGRPYKRGDYGA
jgi:hypothetical protein